MTAVGAEWDERLAVLQSKLGGARAGSAARGSARHTAH
jgi:hypothetical protein